MFFSRFGGYRVGCGLLGCLAETCTGLSFALTLDAEPLHACSLVVKSNKIFKEASRDPKPWTLIIAGLCRTSMAVLSIRRLWTLGLGHIRGFTWLQKNCIQRSMDDSSEFLPQTCEVYPGY